MNDEFLAIGDNEKFHYFAVKSFQPSGVCYVLLFFFQRILVLACRSFRILPSNSIKP